MNADDTYPVDWNGQAWDEVILAQTQTESCIGLIGGDTPNWVLHTPGRLLVDRERARDARVSELLDRHGASPTAAPQVTDTAERLGLTIYEVADERLPALVDDVREIDPHAVSLDHVMVAGSQRWGGGSEPLPIDDPGMFENLDPGVGQGIRIAILDTGIVAEPPFAIEGAAGNAETPDLDRNDERDPPAGHGTHVAGVVAAIAPGATLVAHRMLTGVAGVASEIEVADALLKVADAQLINCSFSGPTLHNVPPVAIERALAQLGEGTVVVACAGNLDTDRKQWPAAFDEVLAVGAVGRDGDAEPWQRASFSDHGEWVDCAAPGVAIASSFLHWQDPKATFAGFASWSGTSMSCPQVTGAIAALASRAGIAVPIAKERLLDDPAKQRVAGLGPVVEATPAQR